MDRFQMAEDVTKYVAVGQNHADAVDKYRADDLKIHEAWEKVFDAVYRERDAELEPLWQKWEELARFERTLYHRSEIDPIFNKYRDKLTDLERTIEIALDNLWNEFCKQVAKDPIAKYLTKGKGLYRVETLDILSEGPMTPQSLCRLAINEGWCGGFEICYNAAVLHLGLPWPELDELTQDV